MARRSRLIAPFLFMFMLASTLACQEPVSFNDDTWRATGILIQDGKMRCSGFALRRVVRGFVFVTAGHCITQTAGMEISFAEGPHGPFYRVDPTTVSVSKTDDVAVMTVLAQPDNIGPTIELGAEERLENGDALFNVAYPQDLGKSRFNGNFISAKFNNTPSWLAEYRWEHAMPIDMPVAPGSSGSPVFDAGQRRVVGIVVGYAGTITIAIPASRIAVLLTEPVSPPVESYYGVQENATLPRRLPVPDYGLGQGTGEEPVQRLPMPISLLP